MLAPWKKSNDKQKQRIKRQRHYFAYKDLSNQSYGFSSSHVQMWELDNKKGWASKNWCLGTVVLEKTLDSPLDSKEIQPVHSKGNQPGIFTERTDAEVEAPLTTWCEQLTHWKRPWCWERLKAGGEGDDRGWDGWMASLTQLTWVWANLRKWWKTGKPGVLQSMGTQKVGHDWGTEQQQQWKNVCVILGRVIREGPSRMVTFEQAPERILWIYGERTFQSGGLANITPGVVAHVAGSRSKKEPCATGAKWRHERVGPGTTEAACGQARQGSGIHSKYDTKSIFGGVDVTTC